MTIEAESRSFGIIASGRPLFVFTIFLGSFLLFLVQPMFARLALPTLGGAPGVWSVALVFYQAALLAGYVYAHLLVKARGRWQPMVHLGLFVLAAATLPITLRGIGGYDELGPTFWLLGTLTVSIGPVFFVVAAQAPLLQHWYAHGRFTAGRDPYFLYAASNAGSLIALAAYPLFFEPYFTVEEQRLIWSAGFLLLAAATGLASRGLADTDDDSAEPARLAAPEDAHISIGTYAYWTALAAVPSGLMLSTTSFLTMDIVSVPLLWVIPLGLYLLSFIVAFSEGGAVFVRQARFAAPLLLIAIGSYSFKAEGVFAFLFAMAGLVLLFYVALALHGELARTRPAPTRLTSFYLTMSVGGVVGGLFPALVAPALFDWVWEHPILLVGAAALLPATPLLRPIARIFEGPSARLVEFAAIGLALLAALIGGLIPAVSGIMPFATILIALFLLGRRAAFAAVFAILLLQMGGFTLLTTSGEARIRSFFGTYAIEMDEGGSLRRLMHGTTLHGAQRIGDSALEPIGYYGPRSGPALLLNEAAADADIGIVGLGVGSLACYAKPGQDWTFYEIDPAVVDIALDTDRFTYLSSCTPNAEIVVGDARLRLEAEERAYDYLIVDAFSSDAIPQHLMTVEAFRLYRDRLAEDGVLIVHISNRYLDLAPVVSAIAGELGMEARLRDNQPEDEVYARSIYAVMSPDPARIEALDETGDWEVMPERDVAPWRDDFGSIVSVLRY
ncbi:hypothetical protein B5C34_08580 [Pacificimonas flava]|uniref:Spermidine synthase n=2 Tax=Pacificimonas TaxID=1960290 RepID=A0A219B6T9_9SPHN|nr:MULTISPECIES: fused MFS/spermidine synthase [Pacificimonas]MBZ6379281.1 fused MFS/spermidine synthase [Pacificimonas aurantium]OWV33509.1 hypothetical protein B5C34_08580 [Pacificimonas flava]